MNNPEYEWAELFQRCLNDGITVVALKSIAEIGSPRYRILSGGVLLSDVNMLAISVETFLPISAPEPLNNPPSEKPIAESADAPIANPLATPAPTISFLIMFSFYVGGLILQLTTGAPDVLD